jgi:uncharacterized membrane protein YccC
MKAWLRQNQAKLQFGLRMTLAALASYAVGHALGFAQVYWAVLSAVMVIQGSVGGSLKAGINRLIGTIGGAIWGAIVAILVPHHDPKGFGIALLIAVAPLAIMTGFRPDYRVAPITAIIVLLGTPLLQSDPVDSAISRVFEISLGSAIAIAVAFFIWPARAHGLLARAASAASLAMAGMASQLAHAAGTGGGAEELMKSLNRIRTLVAQTEARADEAKVERANHLAGGPDPEPLARTMRRLRHDLAMLARALGTPFAEFTKAFAAKPLEEVLLSISAWLEAVSSALAAGEGPPDLDSVHAAVETYKSAVSAAGHGELTYETASSDTQRVFALLFLFDQMLQNLHDLSDRTAELAGAGKASAQNRREPAPPVYPG